METLQDYIGREKKLLGRSVLIKYPGCEMISKIVRATPKGFKIEGEVNEFWQ